MGSSSKWVPLQALKPHRKGIVREILVDGPLTQRMLDLGLVPSTLVEVVREAPLGGPVTYRVRGCYLAMRRTEAAYILVEEVD